MNRKAAAAGTNSKSSHPWVRRLSRFKSRFPRLLRTDYWRASRSRGLWTSLFGARATKSAAKSRRILHRGASQAQFESLETRRVLTTDFSISSVSPTPVAENSLTGIVFNFNRAGSASAAVVTFHASGSANFAVGNPNPGAPTSADYTVTLGGTGAVTFNTTTGIGTVSFSSSVGDDNETVTIVPIGDTDIEGNETVTLTIDSVAGGGGAGAVAPLSQTATINNDDFPSVSIAGTTDGSETGSSPATFTVTQNFVSGSDTHVTFTLGGTATGGGVDYTTPTLSVTIPAGSTSVPITISGAVDDQLVEGPETLIATLTGADNGAAVVAGSDTATRNITDNDTATVTLSGTAAATEGGATGSLTATLTLNTSGTGTPSLQTAITGVTVPSAADYTSSSGSFGVGAVSGATSTLTITAVDDQLVEGPESFPGVTLSAPTSNASISTAGSGTVNVTDNDTATVTLSGTANVTEGGATGSQTVTLTLNTSGTGSPSLATAINGITLASNADFSSDTQSFGAGAVSGATTTLTVTATDDQLVEGTENGLSSSLATPTSTASISTAGSGTVNVTDNDTATVTLSGTAAATEGGATDSLTATLTLNTSGTGTPSLQTAITGVTVPSAADYTSSSGSFGVGAVSGATSTLTITAVDDQLVEGPESFPGVTLSAPTSNASVSTAGSGTVNVTDNDTATVTLSGTANVTEGGATGSQTVTLTLNTSGTGSPSLATAINGITLASNADFSSDTQSFGAGAVSGATTTLTVTATDDQLVEGTENGLSSSLATPTSTASISTAGSGTVNVTDNDTATVTLSGTAAATEGGATGSLTATLTLNTSGTGTPSLQTAITGVTVPSAADYTSSSGSFGVGAVSGATSTLTITAVDDPLVEGLESFPGVTLSAPTSTASVSTAGSGTVNITDNDTATVSVAGTLNGSETGPASATFTVTQSATSSTDTVVAFTLGGTATEGSDYTAITHSVTIPANTTTATITIPVINDAMVESTETVTVTLVSPITSGNAGISVDTTTASRTITDNDSATVSVAGTLNGSETGPTSATFTVTQSATSSTDTVVAFTLGGTATEGSDYTAITHSVTIPANTTTATITIPVINDALVEPTETVTVTLVSPITSGNAGISVDTTTASRTIADNDTTTVSVAGTLNGSETGPASATFTVTQSATSSTDTVVAFTLGGTATEGSDYTAITHSVTIPANTTTATITIPVINDALVEPTETVTVTLVSPITSGNAGISVDTTTASRTITDNDTATVSVAGTLNGSETGPASATFTVTQSATSSTDTVVAFTLGGTATEGSDYTAITHSVTIPANTTTATITIPVINDAMVESTETVTVTLVSPITSGNAGISVDTTTASRTITDNDSATVSVAGTLNGSETGPTSATFTVTQSATSSTDTVVAFTLGGTATEGSDYTAITHSVTIPANTTTATITIPVINDALVEPTETVTVTLVSPITSGNAGISVDTTTASRTIADNDTTTVSVAGTLNGSETGPASATFTVTQSATSSTDTVVAFTLGGTATEGSDYTAITHSVTIPANTTTATITIPVINDALVEPAETVTVTLVSPITSGNAGISVDTTTASRTITDNDTATVSVAGTTDGSETGPVNATYTVTQSAVSSTDTVVAFTLGGTATEGSDYTAITHSVTIPANTTTATITIPVINDAMVESTETVTVTLVSPITSGNAGISVNTTATSRNITDNDFTLVTVTTDSSSVTVNEGSLATDSGTYSQPDGHNVAVTSSIGTVTKTGTSSGTWSWSFTPPDGPSGPTTVTITFTDTVTSSTATGQFPLTVLNVSPTIAVSGNAHTPEGSIYFLTLGAITDPGTDTVTQWTVHWGDGQTSVYPNGGLQSHVYFDGPAVAPITVDLVDEDGTFLNRGNPFTVIVDNVPPSIVLTGNASVNEGGSYSLTLGAISDPGPDTVTAYTVRSGDGATTGPIVGNPTGQVLTHTYADGTTTPTIAVDLTDEDGLELNSGTKTITVNNVAPTIAISGAATVAEGAPYSLTLGAITDPGPDTVTQWIVHWGDGQTTTFTSGGVKTHAYADGPAGPFNITVDLTDEDGTFLNRANALAVSVTNVASTIALTGNATANEGIPYSLTLGGTDPGTDTVTSYTIHWGDGVNTGPVTGNPNGQVVAHTYADGPVSRTITVDVTDEDGTFLVAGTKTITVNNVAPTIALTGNATVNEGAVYSLTLGPVTDPGTDTVTGYTIHWGDGADTGPVTGNPNGQVVTHTYVNGPTSPTITVDLVDEDGTALAAGTKTITVANVAPTLSALSGPNGASFGTTKHYTFSITDPGTLDTFSVATSSGGTQATLSNLTIDNTTRTGGFDATFTGGSGSTTLSLQVKDQDGNLSNVSTLTVSLVNVFEVIGFQTTPSGFDATFNRAPVLSDVTLYDGVDVPDDLPDVTLRAAGANADVRGSLVWNGTTNTLSFVKTGGLLAPDTYSVVVRSSLTGFHDASGRLLDGNGDLNDTQVNDNYVNSFTVAASTARVVSIKDFARGPGQPVNQDPLVANSRLAVSIDNATGVRSVTFTLTYDAGLLHVSTATLAAGFPPDWTLSINSNVPGSLTLTASGATQLSGSNVPLVLITADVPTTAPYGALEALRLAGLAVNIQSGTSTVATPSLADIAVHKNVYLGDADGNGIYTGTDAGLISRVAAGIDTGFDVHSWTDPVIVANIVDDPGTEPKLTGAEAALVAQKSVLLPTPQIPNLPGIPLTPNGGGSLALDDVPQTASASVVSSPSRLAAAVVEVPSATETTTTVVSTFAAPAQSSDVAAASPFRQAVGDRSIVVLPLALESNVGLASGRLAADDGYREPTVTPSLSKTAAEAPRDVDHYFSQLPNEMASEVYSQNESAAAANNHEDDAADCYFESLSEDDRLVAAL